MTTSREQQAYLEAMGIQGWQQRSHARDPAVAIAPGVVAQEPVAAGRPAAVAAKGLETVDIAALDWTPLQQTVAACTRCPLHQGRTQTVFGAGDPHAQWLVVGEAPGEEEDRQGLPFVGRAGELLTAMLKAVGLARSQVYIANILKCRPPTNRDPHSDEVTSCMPFLERQVVLLRPRLILAVGRVAAQNLLHTDMPIGKLRGKVHRYGAQDIPLIATYHPAYLLRSPAEKRKAWEDLQLAQSLLQEG